MQPITREVVTIGIGAREVEGGVLSEVLDGLSYLLGVSYAVFSLRYVGDMSHQSESFKCCGAARPRVELLESCFEVCYLDSWGTGLARRVRVYSTVCGAGEGRVVLPSQALAIASTTACLIVVRVALGLPPNRRRLAFSHLLTFPSIPSHGYDRWCQYWLNDEEGSIQSRIRYTDRKMLTNPPWLPSCWPL